MHKSRAYRQGVKAYSDGEESCPYDQAIGKMGVSVSGKDMSTMRTKWWSGYLDARTDDRLGDVFDKWKLGRMTE